MALVLKKLYQGYYWVFDELSDPRTDELDLFLMSSPIKPILVVSAYMYFVYNLGPRLMANRRPFDLKNVIIVYNLAQIILNTYIFIVAFDEMLRINWDCASIDYSSSPRALYVLRMYHLFFLIKLIDLLDTVFFVLRKRYRQVSFLHVYHHFGMFLMMWMAVKFFGGGAGIYTGVINALVHSVMYVYYFLTAIDDKWKSSVAFKKTITQMQITQFILFIIIYGRLLIKTDCTYPKLTSYFFVPQNCFMLVLFGNFYIKTYMSKKNVAGAPKSDLANGKEGFSSVK